MKIINEIISKQNIKNQERLTKQNENRQEPPTLSNGKIYVKNVQRKTKLQPAFDKKQVSQDNGLTFVTDKKMKYHKSKIKLRK